MKGPSEMTQIRRKKARGEPLTDEERAKLTAFHRKYYRQKKTVHIKGKREQEWQQLAESQGVSLSAWIQEQVAKALHGNEDALRELRQENQRLRDEITALRGTCGQLSLENSKLHTRIEGLEAGLVDATKWIREH
ncbi:MAG: hypothetical protein AABX89_03935 [Candidatus Thermoplasmatota archaeon]